MDNSEILRCLEKQRDDQFNKLNGKTISGLYQELHDDIKDGRVVILVDDQAVTPKNLKKLCQDKSHDLPFAIKVNSYKLLDNRKITEHFKNELERVFKQMTDSNKVDEIQAMFIEYNYYYYYESGIVCYGKQNYPIIKEPRYISSEYDYNKQILFIINGINFQPAWPSCEEFDNLNYLDVHYELEELFRLHSRVLLHKAIASLNEDRKLEFIKNKPFTFYINEHDCEVMMLYRLT